MLLVFVFIEDEFISTISSTAGVGSVEVDACRSVSGEARRQLGSLVEGSG